MEDFFVEADFAGLLIHTDCVKIMTVHRGTRHPDLAVHDHGSAPAAVMDFSFPFDVVGLAPMKRKVDRLAIRGLRRNHAVPCRSAKLRPISASGGKRESNRDDGNDKMERAKAAQKDGTLVWIHGDRFS